MVKAVDLKIVNTKCDSIVRKKFKYYLWFTVEQGSAEM